MSNGIVSNTKPFTFNILGPREAVEALRGLSYTQVLKIREDALNALHIVEASTQQVLDEVVECECYVCHKIEYGYNMPPAGWGWFDKYLLCDVHYKKVKGK